MQKKAIDLVTAPKYKITALSIEKAIPLVQKLQGKDLRDVYLKICGGDGLLKLKNNTEVLRRKICYALQKKKSGGLSVRHYNMLYRLEGSLEAVVPQDKFQPKPGTVMARRWQGIDHYVYVRANAFEYNGKNYTSLSKIAKEITRHERSGPVFFGLKKESGAT